MEQHQRPLHMLTQQRCLSQTVTTTKRAYHAGKIVTMQATGEEEMSEKDRKKALKAKAKEAMAAAAENEGGDDAEAKKEALKAKLAAKKEAAAALSNVNPAESAQEQPPKEKEEEKQSASTTTDKEEGGAATTDDNSQQDQQSTQGEGDAEPIEYSSPELTRDAALHKAGMDAPDRPAYQNPLHHNNPEVNKMFREDFDSEEEFLAAQAKVKLPGLEREDGTIPVPQHIEELADECVHLTMLEMNELVNRLQQHFGFPESGGGDDGSAGGDGEAEDGGDDEDAPAEAASEAKTAFNVKLMSFDAKAKIKVIKEVRALAALGLKEAKEVVEQVPSTIVTGVNRETAEAIKVKLEELGAQVEIE
ncbi:hypothetical protein ACA910_020738 [Epithemia clementina (nom. ined.)]